jgi:hypothetical protein
VQRVRAERRLQASPHLLDLDAQGTQRICRIDTRPKRWTDAQQFGACGGQIQALRLQQGSGLARAVPQQSEQHMLVRQAGVAKLAGLDEGEPHHFSAVRGEPFPYGAHAVVAYRGTE